jgi:hypothetical protein
MALPIGKKRAWKQPTAKDPTATLGGWWWGVYAVLGAIGVVLAIWSYGSWSQ